jgi:hypothetical protein
MYIHNDLHVKFYAEDYIRARLLEADHYRMLNQLRKCRKNGILRSFHLFLGRLGRWLILLGERLERVEISTTSYGEDGWKGLSTSG